MGSAGKLMPELLEELVLAVDEDELEPDTLSRSAGLLLPPPHADNKAVIKC